MVIIDAMERRIKLKTLNSHITCKICRGYLIDATTVTECLHTFCKSCLVKHLEEKHTCPTCQIVIHQSHPLQYISFDRTMQDIVYKLVPDLQESKSFISIDVNSRLIFAKQQSKIERTKTSKKALLTLIPVSNRSLYKRSFSFQHQQCFAFQMKSKERENFTEPEVCLVLKTFYPMLERSRRKKPMRMHMQSRIIIVLTNRLF